MSTFQQSLVAVPLIALGLSLISTASKGSRTDGKNTPPIVHIPEDVMFTNPREAYEKALSDFGHVVGVWRKGRLEYIVDDEITHEVLTNTSSYSFEEGTVTILNLQFFYRMFGSTFFRDLDDLVHKAIIARMPVIVEQEFPVFMKYADGLIDRSQINQSRDGRALGKQNDRAFQDIFEHAHKSISEAMAVIILGPRFVTERNLEIIERVAADMAQLTGIYQNTSRFARTVPSVWRLLICIKVIVFTVVFGYFRVIGPQVWSELRSRKFSNKKGWRGDTDDGTILDYLFFKYAKADGGKVGFRSYLSIMALMVAIIFASVHQTASLVVWVVFEVARRPEYLPILREELVSSVAIDALIGHPIVSYDALQNATHLDSFVREVLRTKGDTLSTCRKTVTDVEIKGFRISAGSLMIPMASLSHLNTKYHGPDAADFNGERWVGSGKQAATVSEAYFPFGLGRWACPGRVLAVTEIKMIIWSIIYRATPVLKNNTYRIVDPLNITSVPPEGKVMLEPYST